MGNQSILWQRLDQPGYEFGRLSLQPTSQHLFGTAVFAENQRPCRLDYLIVCDSKWQTLSGKVTGWVGNEMVEIEIEVDSDRCWRLNGKDCPQVTGCLDIDLNFSPSTNLLPIRRLNLAVGQKAEVRAAWLRFPGFTIEPLEQLYRRTDDATYHYESAGGSFVTDLQVNTTGFVTRYPNLWQVEAITSI
jgi:hypothetical protein